MEINYKEIDKINLCINDLQNSGYVVFVNKFKNEIQLVVSDKNNNKFVFVYKKDKNAIYNDTKIDNNDDVKKKQLNIFQAIFRRYGINFY